MGTANPSSGCLKWTGDLQDEGSPLLEIREDVRVTFRGVQPVALYESHLVKAVAICVRRCFQGRARVGIDRWRIGKVMVERGRVVLPFWDVRLAECRHQIGAIGGDSGDVGCKTTVVRVSGRKPAC